MEELKITRAILVEIFRGLTARIHGNISGEILLSDIKKSFEKNLRGIPESILGINQANYSWKIQSGICGEIFEGIPGEIPSGIPGEILIRIFGKTTGESQKRTSNESLKKKPLEKSQKEFF